MKKGLSSIFIIISVVAITLLGLGYYLLTQFKEREIDPASFTVQESSTSTPEEQNSNIVASNYVEYSGPETLTDNQNENIVLFFYANWCPTCRPVDRQLTENSDQISANLTIIRVNYNDNATDSEEGALAEKYGVTYQHTFVEIDENGNELQKWNGGGLEEILSKINN